jgi:hypothetical protein
MGEEWGEAWGVCVGGGRVRDEGEWARIRSYGNEDGGWLHPSIGHRNPRSKATDRRQVTLRTSLSFFRSVFLFFSPPFLILLPRLSPPLVYLLSLRQLTSSALFSDQNGGYPQRRI